jgi:hypothetical protein
MHEPPHDPPDTADPGPPYEPPAADELPPEETAGTAAAGPGVNTNVC